MQSTISAPSPLPAPKLTAFQKHVLNVVRALGPMSCADVAKKCHPHRKHVMKALYRLRKCDLVYRGGQGYSAAAADELPAAA